MNVNFELYKIFYHCAKLQSFSNAAKKLFITQSAVSQAIKNLESELGGQLFFRKGRKVILTWEGEMLFKHIEQAYNFIKTAESKLQEVRNLDVGEVRIGVSDTICKYFLIPHLEKFYGQYPNVKIQVLNRTSRQILELLKNGLLDLGIATMPVQEENIQVEEFIEVEDVFVACHQFSHLRNGKVSLQQLAEYPLLMLDKNSSTRRNIDLHFKQKGITITPEIELESVDLLVEFARIGLGIAYVLKESAQAEIENSKLFLLDVAGTLPTRKLGICTVRDVPLSLAAGKFIQFLQK
jgi:DNA-binding transcriptional LysR family regulator